MREDGYREVPNLMLELIKGQDILQFCFEAIKEYYEDYDSENGAIVYFTSALLSPDCYDAITSQNYDTYILTKYMLWRNADDGTDYEHKAPPLTFKSITLTHRVGYDGEPADWEFNLRN